MTKKGEIWGKIWEHIAWNEEERRYQRLTNALFMAAKDDLIEGGDSTKNLDQFIENLYVMPNEDDAIYSDIESQEKLSVNKDKLKASLLEDYMKLKETLKDVRVLGVGNSKLQACANACKILLRTMVTIAILPAIALASTALGSTLPITALAATSIVGGIGAGAIAFAESIIPSAKLAAIRSNLKETLKEVPTELSSPTSNAAYSVNGEAVLPTPYIKSSAEEKDKSALLPRPVYVTAAYNKDSPKHPLSPTPLATPNSNTRFTRVEVNIGQSIGGKR